MLSIHVCAPSIKLRAPATRLAERVKILPSHWFTNLKEVRVSGDVITSLYSKAIITVSAKTMSSFIE